MVLLMVDPVRVRALHAGGGLCGLGDAELELLRRVDPRAWHTDPYRRARLLTTVIEELPVTVALLGAEADAFFSAPAFEAVVCGRGELVPAFAAWAAAGGSSGASPPRGRAARAPEAPRAAISAISAIEGAMAVARRARPPRGAGLALRPGAAVLRARAGAVDAWSSGLAALAGGATDTLAAAARAVATGATLRPPALGRGEACWLFLRGADGGFSVSGLSHAMASLLELARTPCPRGRLERYLVDAGAGDEVDAILGDLLGDGTLIEAAPPRPTALTSAAGPGATPAGGAPAPGR